jgi:hypothetical protein
LSIKEERIGQDYRFSFTKKAKIVGQFAKPPAAEDLEDTFLKNEFKRISKGKSGITFKQFCRWDELQQLMHDERITLEDLRELWSDLRELWSEFAEKDAQIDVATFIEINQALEEALEEEDEETDLEGEDEYLDEDELNASTNSFEEIWDLKNDPTAFFDETMLEHLKKSFVTLTKVSPIAQKLTLPQFLEWKEIMNLMEEGDIDEESVLELWQEAVEFERTSSGESDKNSPKSNSSKELPISLNTFLRLNARLDDVMIEINEAGGPYQHY